MGDSTASGVHCAHVGKDFKHRALFRDLNLRVPPGDHVALIGANGSGKTTLLKIIAGLTIFDTGTIDVMGTFLRPKRHIIPSGIGLVLDGLHLLPHFTGLENLRLLDLLSPKSAHCDLHRVLREVGLDPEDRRKVSQYSLGMRQRLNLAQALVPRPHLLLLDEPSNGLDPEGIQWLVQWIQGLADITVIMASHRLDEVSVTCSSVWQIADGAIVPEQDPPPKEHIK